MRAITLATVWSFLMTLVAAVALRADSIVLALAAMASFAAIVAWFTAQHSSEDVSGLAQTGSAAAVSLTLARRHPFSLLLPIVTGQLVGAIIAGFAVSQLNDELGPVLGWFDPSLASVIIGATLIGLIGGWLILFIDGYLNEGLAAFPVLLGGGLLPIGYALAFQPAVLIGLATANITEWSTSLIAGGCVLAAAAIAGFSLPLLLNRPVDESHSMDTSPEI